MFHNLWWYGFMVKEFHTKKIVKRSFIHHNCRAGRSTVEKLAGISKILFCCRPHHTVWGAHQTATSNSNQIKQIGPHTTRQMVDQSNGQPLIDPTCNSSSSTPPLLSLSLCISKQPWAPHPGTHIFLISSSLWCNLAALEISEWGCYCTRRIIPCSAVVSVVYIGTNGSSCKFEPLVVRNRPEIELFP